MTHATNERELILFKNHCFYCFFNVTPSPKLHILLLFLEDKATKTKFEEIIKHAPNLVNDPDSIPVVVMLEATI
jgi:hypothetical protein